MSKLYKKTIIVWATSQHAAAEAGQLAVETVRTLANATAFGLISIPVQRPADDPDFDPCVDALLEG